MDNLDTIENNNNDNVVSNEGAGDVIPMTTILPPLLAFFLDLFPEFKPLAAKEEPNYKTFLNTFEKVKCLYLEYKNVNDTNIKECEYLPFFLLVAHYITIGGAGLDVVSMSKPGGLVASASVGDVSTSYQQNPYKDSFEYFLSQTTYGQQYLSFLSRKSGVRYVN